MDEIILEKNSNINFSDDSTLSAKNFAREKHKFRVSTGI